MQDKPVALVTGANQGIGLQIAKDLAAKNFTGSRSAHATWRGEEAAKTVEGDARALQLDVTDQASIAAAKLERIRDELGRLDVLVNNAAISNTGMRPGMSVEEYSESTRPSNVSLDEVRAVWETNVFKVVVAFTKAMLPLLRRAPAARIVNVSSEATSSADEERGPGLPPARDLRPRLPGVQDRPQRHHPRHGDRAGADRDQGQRGLPGLHQDEPQQPCRHADCPRRRYREPVRLALLGPDGPTRHVLERSGTAPVVTRSPSA